jgi:hypothetical protein
MQTWIIPAAIGGLIGYRALQPNEKYLNKIPKIGKKTGIVLSGAMFLVAYMMWKTGEMQVSMLIDSTPPGIEPLEASGFSAPAFVEREPVGYLTGIGRDEAKAEVPSSSLSTFPY